MELFHATLPVTALEITALLVLLLDLSALRRASTQARIGAAVVLGVLGCAAAFCLFHFHAAPGFSGPELQLTNLGYSAVAQPAILILTAITLLLLPGSKFTRHPGEFIATILFAASGALLAVAAQDLLVLFAGLELLSLSLYILTAFAKFSSKSAEAGLKYYLFGGTSAAFMLFGFSYLYGLTGSVNFSAIARSLAENGTYDSPLFLVAMILIAAGLGFKVAAVPFHLWPPDAYEGAPAPAAAFIASASKVASFALLAGLAYPVYFTLHCGHAMPPGSAANGGRVLAVIAILAAFSMIAGNLAALVQSSVRRLLAYSAIAHGGYMLLGVYAGFLAPAAQTPARNVNAVLFYIITYAVTAPGAFGVIGAIEQETGSDKLDALSGLHKRNPLLAGILLVLFLSLAGIPPLAGLWTKFNLFAAVLGTGAGPVPFTLVALAVAMSAVSLYYYLRVLKYAYVVPPLEGAGPIRVHPVALFTLAVIAAAVVYIGCNPAALGDWITSTGQSIL
jgi:NADH-quinone oxidoreductase subunit N